MEIYVFVIVFLVLICPVVIIGHPQCLNFQAPIKPIHPLQFCGQYANLGCCTSDDDYLLQTKYESIYKNMSGSDADLWADCGDYVKDFLCQECSPYSAHIFHAEETKFRMIFPGLCKGYCRTFYQKCSQIFHHVYTHVTPLLSAARAGEDTFCNHVRADDADYCFPDLLTNDMLNDNLSHKRVDSKDCLCVQKFDTALDNPIFTIPAHDGTRRLFVGEQNGLISIFYPDGTKEPDYFLDITDDLFTYIDKRYDEKGLLGLAFHPNFSSNRRFYLHYSAKCAEGQICGDHRQLLVEVKVSETNANVADKDTIRELLDIPEPFMSHNGGSLYFGMDGYLYLSVGDGGAAGDPYNNAQNLKTLLGKMLRIDVDATSPGKAYGIPPDNPFVNNSDPRVRPEIFAYGLRNAWKCAIDKGDHDTGYGAGRIICGDVGQDMIEEVDIIQKGANYGWRAYEGDLPFKIESFAGSVHERPIFNYTHKIGKSITGGPVYRGDCNPSLQGAYIYGDFQNGRLFKLTENRTVGKWKNTELFMCHHDICAKTGLESRYSQHILSFGEDENGEIYILATLKYTGTSKDGHLYKILEPGSAPECRQL